MTPAKMFDGDLWMLASDAVAMAENAYKKGQTDEREACAAGLEDMAAEAKKISPEGFVWKTAQECATAIRARGQE